MGIGMFATDSWKINASAFGDGECFIFRASPDPQCYNWTPDLSGNFDLENNTVREQFMMAKARYIAMGASTDGTNGVRLDEDLVTGESHRALGFDNEPLPGFVQASFHVG